jgi:hypothetical protein
MEPSGCSAMRLVGCQSPSTAAHCAERDEPIRPPSYVGTVCWLSRVVASIAFAVSCPQLARGQDDAASKNDTASIARIRFLVEGYLANRASFTHYSCKMRLRQGKNSSLSKAYVGGPDRGVAIADANLLVDGAMVSYSRKSSDKPVYDPTLAQATLNLPPGAILSDGNTTLDVDLFAAAGNVKKAFRGIDYTTWNPGGITSGTDGEFGSYVGRNLAADAKVVFHGAKIVDGEELTSFDIGSPDSMKSFDVDEQRGFIPVTIRSFYKGRPFVTIKTTEIRSISRDRWFPIRSVAVWHVGEADSGDHIAREVVATTLDTESRPARSAFKIVIPGGTRLGIENTHNTAFSLKEPSVISLDMLNNLERIGLDTAASRDPKSSVLTGSRKVWLWFGLLVASSVAIAVFVYRYRRS